MKQTLGIFLLSTFFVASAFAIGNSRPAAPKLRIGTYDNRSIAVAYAPSRFNPLKERMAEFEKARRSGDAARMKELTAWGEKQQRSLHRQGFARAPVNDLLASVKEGLGAVAQKRGLDVIVWSCDYAGPDADVVDVTDDLVLLFEPSEKTIGMAREIRGHDPLDLDEIEHGHKD